MNCSNTSTLMEESRGRKGGKTGDWGKKKEKKVLDIGVNCAGTCNNF